MPKLLDISHYQVKVDDKTVMVQDLTLEQLQQEVCRQMEVIEQLEDNLNSVKSVISQWRQGRVAIR